MDESLYNSDIICPVCSKKFTVTKVKSNSRKVSSYDTDFCVNYEGLNPILYDAWVCENCGYAALSDKFSTIPDRDIKTTKENIMQKWTKRSFAGERNVATAIEAFKIALYNLMIRKAKSSEFAKVCLRIAWMYRSIKDDKEVHFLGFALKFYMETFEKERFPVDKLDEAKCMYMIAELCRRTNNFEESVRWFSKLVTSPEGKRNSKLLDQARDQLNLAKQQMADNEVQNENRQDTK